MIEIENLNKTLANMAEKLGEDGMNYVVDIKLFSAGNLVTTSASAVLRECFGFETKSREHEVVLTEDLLDTMRAALNYKGEIGAYPSKQYLASQEHIEAIEQICTELRRRLEDVRCITSIIIEEQHPFYPVFWDFSYIIELSDQVFVLVGSASD